MATTHQAFIGFSLFLIVSLAGQAVAGRGSPMDTKVQPQCLGKHDRSVLIPGIGRFMIPKKGDNLANYNPITGAPGGHGVSIPRAGSSPSPKRNYIPGGDDTFVPNPGVEVPISGGGGRTPATSHP